VGVGAGVEEERVPWLPPHAIRADDPVLQPLCHSSHETDARLH
jgi:hypothetical protein